MSEVVRQHMKDVVSDGRDALNDEQLREVEKAVAKAEGRDESSDARKRIRVTERVKGMFQQPYSVEEIEKDIRSYIRVDELEGRERRARYFRGLLEMVELFRGYNEWDERDALPPSVFAAIDSYALQYPEEHLDYLEDLAAKAGKETNGYLSEDATPEDFEISLVEDGENPELDGGRYNV
jgi:hypothetical protein